MERPLEGAQYHPWQSFGRMRSALARPAKLRDCGDDAENDDRAGRSHWPQSHA
jgi:hypothetical protein